MDALGINISSLIVQLITVTLFVLPIITLIDLAKKRISGVPLALWALVICAVPLLGALSYWIVKPTAETKI